MAIWDSLEKGRPLDVILVLALIAAGIVGAFLLLVQFLK